MAIITVSFLSELLPIAIGLILLSAAFIALLNKGSPRKITVDKYGLLVSIRRQKFRINKENIVSATAQRTVSFTFFEGKKKQALLWKTSILLGTGCAIPLYEGPSRQKADELARQCMVALEKGESGKKNRKNSDALTSIDQKTYSITMNGNESIIEVPVTMNIPGFLMAGGMLSGFGIILFAILPGRGYAIAMGVAAVIWALLCIVYIAALFFGLFGWQKLVIGQREVEAQRGIFRIRLPSAILERKQGTATYLDLEDNSLSILPSDMRRELDEIKVKISQGQDLKEDETAADMMATFSTGRIVRIDVSALNWVERFVLEAEINTILRKG
jgi:hypothetical protein